MFPHRAAAVALDDATCFTSMFHDCFDDLPNESCREFLEIMKDFTENKCAAQEVFCRVETLIRVHPRLQVAFNSLLPIENEYRIDSDIMSVGDIGTYSSPDSTCSIDMESGDTWGSTSTSSSGFLVQDALLFNSQSRFSWDVCSAENSLHYVVDNDQEGKDLSFPISPTSVSWELDATDRKLLRPGKKGQIQLVHINVKTSQLHRHSEEEELEDEEMPPSPSSGTTPSHFYTKGKKGIKHREEKKRSSREPSRPARPKIDSMPLPEVSVMSPELVELKQQIEASVQKVNATKHRHRKGGPCPRCQVENQLRAAKRAYHKRALAQNKCNMQSAQRRKLSSSSPLNNLSGNSSTSSVSSVGSISCKNSILSEESPLKDSSKRHSCLQDENAIETDDEECPEKDMRFSSLYFDRKPSSLDAVVCQ